MRRIFYILILWTFLVILFPVQTVSAQHGDPPPLPADAWKGNVVGKVVNQTTGEMVAEPVDVMLHAWDNKNQQRLMLHGKAESDGTFRFEDVDFHQSFSYSVMSTYLGATYFSEAAIVEKGETSLALDAQVYDTANDLSNISIDQLHVLFYRQEGQLGVTQFYSLSNSSQYTVKDAVTLPRERTGTLKFHLPDEAQNVRFGKDSSGSRYVLLPGGFADTDPIPPGENVSQITVGYNLPYTEKLEYNYIAPVAVKAVSFLVLDGSGLSLEGENLTAAGEQTLQDGSKFNVLKAAPMEAGESILLTLSGEPGGKANDEAGLLQNRGNQGLAIGAGVLGLASLSAGVWWWRRREDGETEEIRENNIEDILAEIESLEQAYQQGELPENEYLVKRTDLRNRLKTVTASSSGLTISNSE